jgi:acylphosphatase
MTRKAAHVIFEGRVQGVFFRANTQKKARGMGITGWVRNMDNGSVEAFFEGEAQDIRSIIEEISQGNGMGAARVDNSQVRWSDPECFADFDVLR